MLQTVNGSKKKLKRAIKHTEANESGNTAYQNLYGEAEAVLRGKL